ncbi:hypothetical protein JK200_18265, partial [Gluconobacter cerinus]|nr:hypothetical protein [Gluconobacter cerinus]
MSGTVSRSSGTRSSGEITLMLAGVALLGMVVLAYMVWSTFHTEISRFYCKALIWQIGILSPTPELAHLNIQL